MPRSRASAGRTPAAKRARVQKGGGAAKGGGADASTGAASATRAATRTATGVSAGVTELRASRVRLEVSVSPQELERRVEREARALSKRVKVPGFRRGKVPAPLVIGRLGREAVVESAVRASLGDWYAEAIEQTRVVPVGDPRISLGELPAAGEPFELQIEVGVLPKATLGEYRGLEVGRREPVAAEEAIDEELAALREQLARLDDVDRRSEAGDYVVIDFKASREGRPLRGAEGRDRLVELGAGRLVPGLEEGLVGARAGETRTIEARFPEDHVEGELAGAEATFEVTVKAVKRKELPELDDDFAADAGFGSLEELRGDIAERLRELDGERVEREFREAALDAAVAQARVDVPDELAQARAQEMWERTLRALARQGVSRETYIRMTGASEEQAIAQLQESAARALRREAVLTAVVQAEGIAPSDEELAQALEEGDGSRPRDLATSAGEQAASGGRAQDGRSGRELVERLRGAGRLEEVREEVAARRAMELIAAQAKPIPLARAKAREKLWTPERELAQVGGAGAAAAGGPERRGAGEGAAGRLWTPGS